MNRTVFVAFSIVSVVVAVILSVLVYVNLDSGHHRNKLVVNGKVIADIYFDFDVCYYPNIAINWNKNNFTSWWCKRGKLVIENIADPQYQYLNRKTGAIDYNRIGLIKPEYEIYGNYFGIEKKQGVFTRFYEGDETVVSFDIE